jgi:hypothetical protein
VGEGESERTVSSRIVGNPSLTGLWKGCPSTVRDRTPVQLSSWLQILFLDRGKSAAFAQRGEVADGNQALCSVEQAQLLSNLDLLHHLHLQSRIEDLQLQSASVSRLILKIGSFAG